MCVHKCCRLPSVPCDSMIVERNIRDRSMLLSLNKKKREKKKESPWHHNSFYKEAIQAFISHMNYNFSKCKLVNETTLPMRPFRSCDTKRSRCKRSEVTPQHSIPFAIQSGAGVLYIWNPEVDLGRYDGENGVASSESHNWSRCSSTVGWIYRVASFSSCSSSLQGYMSSA